MVVTGMAWCTALGVKLDEVWSRLLAGDTGLREVPSAHPVRNLLAAAVDAPPAAREPARRQVALAADTVGRALDDAGLDAATSAALLVAGTSYGAHLDDAGTTGLHDWAVETADRAGLSRPPVSLSTACSSGSDAVLVAAELVAAGVAERAVCGGADVLTSAKRLGHTALGTMSPTTLRAFDPRADGMLLGEGAGFLVLESADSAARRRATAYAVVRGGGASNDAAGMTAPDASGDSVLLAVHRSLAAAGAAPADVAVVNAHGSGTPLNDAVESRSFARLWPGERRP
ncbi:MAG TPA: beta-ketoacyl synthase N-terminal-like domain-containing protein, partial [Mycobacteriales bacterium]|nr:beta-ketoacyl synthase N-terminal-like domain-containing protein [Mycobacteriales bacterium]